MYFDSHSHLDEACFGADRDDIFTKMQNCGVFGCMDVGCDLESSYRAVRLAEQHENVFAAVGSHPEAADRLTDAVLEQYRVFCRHPKVRAVGEIGLDYHYEDNPPREVQKAAFRRQLALAAELHLPVIVHERDAHGDAMQIIAEYPQVRGVFHCYSGALEMAKELVKRGWYLGFTGVVTFKNARKAIEVAEWLPLSRLLVETDCPYMAPEPHRGTRCDPSMVHLTAERIAEIKGISPAQVGEITTQNAKTLFGI